MQSRISWTRAWSSALGQAADSFWPDMVRLAWVVCVVEESRSENARVHCGCSPRRVFVEEQSGDLAMQIGSSTRRLRKKKKRAAGPSFERCRVAERSGVHPTAGLPNATGGTGPVQGTQLGDQARPQETPHPAKQNQSRTDNHTRLPSRSLPSTTTPSRTRLHRPRKAAHFHIHPSIQLEQAFKMSTDLW